MSKIKKTNKFDWQKKLINQKKYIFIFIIILNCMKIINDDVTIVALGCLNFGQAS